MLSSGGEVFEDGLVQSKLPQAPGRLSHVWSNLAGAHTSYILLRTYSTCIICDSVHTVSSSGPLVKMPDLLHCGCMKAMAQRML